MQQNYRKLYFCGIERWQLYFKINEQFFAMSTVARNRVLFLPLSTVQSVKTMKLMQTILSFPSGHYPVQLLCSKSWIYASMTKHLLISYLRTNWHKVILENKLYKPTLDRKKSLILLQSPGIHRKTSLSSQMKKGNVLRNWFVSACTLSPLTESLVCADERNWIRWESFTIKLW